MYQLLKLKNNKTKIQGKLRGYSHSYSIFFRVVIIKKALYVETMLVFKFYKKYFFPIHEKQSHTEI